MKSPFTGGNVALKHEVAELTFRKEKFQYIHLFYECIDSKERFTTSELDEISIGQVYNQYRVKYAIPFPEDILNTRLKYGLSALKMSKILGFGDNQYRLYENGDMPSEANGKILMSIKDKYVFETFVKNARSQFDNGEYEKIVAKIHAIEDDDSDSVINYLFNGNKKDVYNGYVTHSLVKLKNLLLFYISRYGGVFFTMMNKLLFYTDFCHYKMYGKGISGLSYKAIQYGPVPMRWDRVYSFYNDIQQEIVCFASGVEGAKLISDVSPNMDCFSKSELRVLDKVYQCFRLNNSTQIAELSHSEDAWIKNVGSGNLISYSMAFDLKALDDIE